MRVYAWVAGTTGVHVGLIYRAMGEFPPEPITFVTAGRRSANPRASHAVMHVMNMRILTKSPTFSPFLSSPLTGERKKTKLAAGGRKSCCGEAVNHVKTKWMINKPKTK